MAGPLLSQLVLIGARDHLLKFRRMLKEIDHIPELERMVFPRHSKNSHILEVVYQHFDHFGWIDSPTFHDLLNSWKGKGLCDKGRDRLVVMLSHKAPFCSSLRWSVLQ